MFVPFIYEILTYLPSEQYKLQYNTCTNGTYILSIYVLVLLYIYSQTYSQYKTCINASSISVYEGGTVVMYLHRVLYSAGRGGLAIYLA